MEFYDAITTLFEASVRVDAIIVGEFLFALGLVFLLIAVFVAFANVKKATLASSYPLLTTKSKSLNTSNRLENAPDIAPQLTVIWRSANNSEIVGDLQRFGSAIGFQNPFDFGSWLNGIRNEVLNGSILALRSNGEPFQLTLQAENGRHIEVEGAVIDGDRVLRIRTVDTQRQEFLKISNDYENLKIEMLGLRAILDTISQPIWLRDRDGRISWVNESYAFAVDAQNGPEVVAKQIEFFDTLPLNGSKLPISSGDVFNARLPAIVSGQRRIFDVVETPLAAGSIGYATDVSDIEAIRSDMHRQMASHVGTLDQLPTAVAIFDEKHTLVFCNLAYKNLWQLDDSFLDARPNEGEILDRLRDSRRLPEQADYKNWKKALQEAYQALETQEMVWYLPGGQTLRVVVNPNPQGGVTYLFEDVTAQFTLQSNFNALSRVQNETLDSLNEGVAVFGADGRLKLKNPAFEKIWDLSDTILATQPHIDQIISEAARLYDVPDVWTAIKGSITGVSDARQSQSFRMERSAGSIIDCVTAPLPDGATLVTFVDVSASVNVERALKERNEALVQAGQLRENFVHHVSYQLRSPLTNVIGFTEMLAAGAAGRLTDRQSEYVGHVFESSKALMVIIDDILDLASFDRGEISIDRRLTRISDLVSDTISGLQDRVSERKLQLHVLIEENVTEFLIDAKRVRQILFNLLSNAIGFSSEGQTISLVIRETEEALTISVEDEGRGIPPEIIDRVFDRFETFTTASRHRGAGLGLSIVKSLMELHDGDVFIKSELGGGTLVTCRFPKLKSAEGKIEAA